MDRRRSEAGFFARRNPENGTVASRMRDLDRAFILVRNQKKKKIIHLIEMHDNALPSIVNMAATA